MKQYKLNKFEKTALKAVDTIGKFAAEYDSEFISAGAILGGAGGMAISLLGDISNQHIPIMAASMLTGGGIGHGVGMAFEAAGEKARRRLWKDKLNFEQEK
jgi:hypothetical protein